MMRYLLSVLFLTGSLISNVVSLDLMVGRRRIQAKTGTILGDSMTTPNKKLSAPRATDAIILDTRWNIPCIVAYFGFQAVLASMAAGSNGCGSSFLMEPSAAAAAAAASAEPGYLCPPEYWSPIPFVSGLGVLGAAARLVQYAKENRLCFDGTGLQTGTIVQPGEGNDSELLVVEPTGDDKILFQDIQEWSVAAWGLTIETKEPTKQKRFFPIFWDPKSVEALLEDRIN